MKRKGQALIVVVIIFALIVSVFAISLSTSMHYQALEATEIYQREQALYLAQMAINQMIYNINDGANYTNPLNNSITITAPSVPDAEGKAIYYTPDDSGYGGMATVKGEGTVGKFPRVIYASLQPWGFKDAFKYCLFTATGNYTKTNYDEYPTIGFTNNTWSDYTYNTFSATTPYPDWSWYTNSSNYPAELFVPIDLTGNQSYNPFTSGSGKVVYIHYTGSTATDTLTVEFTSEDSSTPNINLSIITDYPVVVFKHIGTKTNGNKGWDTSWNPINYDPTHQYPLLIHNPTLTSSSSVTFNEDLKGNDNHTFTVNGLIYSKSSMKFLYSAKSPPGTAYSGYITIKGELIANSLNTDWDYNETTFTYSNNYFTNPPPHFIYKFLPHSFREEY